MSAVPDILHVDSMSCTSNPRYRTINPQIRCHPERRGCANLCCSNHGGRQCDCVPAAVEMLPHVIDAIGHVVPIIVDGGFRRGTDVLKVIQFCLQIANGRNCG